MKFQRETVEGIIVEVLPLLQKHYQEISPYRDIELNPDFELFKRADSLNILRLYSARFEGRLIGYAVFFLKGHQHYKHSLQATLDLLFIDPSFRGRGREFLRFMEDQLTKEGAEVINFVVTSKFNYSALLKRMGYWQNEVTYTKRIPS